ncbi:DUF86 domain-containing protein [Neobacillus notoginsengisoli]|uniref:DUF86 domain-containing protein n=1 Tax=Neobacillus notoginsengisoli TaxID=1578198 RepID=A0A417YXZ7_9BACI|nr:DUF86 domain-containing protein [Neobacillus notoginsengisoli]RHW42648.1 DUF86 domain-containing protein [Neobacillus notoginsengisoli]
MYFVDRNLMEQKLRYIEQQTGLFKSREQWESPLEKAALERVAHMLTEAVLDVGNAMIDGFIMRDPGSYEDIIDILLDEKVIDRKTGEDLKILVSHRKQLVQDYTEIDHARLYDDLTAILAGISEFPELVRTYLTNELGPVSAFKPH